MPDPDAPASPSCVLSFRHLLTEAMQAFLVEAELDAPGCEEALGELAVTLSRYREEGVPLFPVAFLGDALAPMLEVLGGRHPIQVGVGPRTRETVQRALKQCAQLGQGRWWGLYLLVVPEGLAYGVFRTDPNPLSETPLERLRRAEDRKLHVVGVLQLAENVIELRARGGLHRHVFLSGARQGTTLPTLALDGLAGALTSDVAGHLKEETRDFFRRVLFEAMQSSHGTLMAVLPRARERSALFVDGILLPEPVDVAACIARTCAGAPGSGDDAEVYALAQLLRGMMATDGITVLRSDGCIVGYNVFIHHPARLSRGPGVVGGARRRTYDVLCASVGSDLAAAFIRSQDGAIDFCGAGPSAFGGA